MGFIFSLNIWLDWTIILLTYLFLGLMDDGDSGQDPATAQGAYLSFLHLRHLRLRDLQRTVSI